MNSTLIYFDGDYYEYHVVDKKEQVLEIGEYESAFLADMIAYHLFLKSKTFFILKIYHGINQDYVLVVSKGKKVFKI